MGRALTQNGGSGLDKDLGFLQESPDSSNREEPWGHVASRWEGQHGKSEALQPSGGLQGGDRGEDHTDRTTRERRRVRDTGLAPLSQWTLGEEERVKTR